MLNIYKWMNRHILLCPLMLIVIMCSCAASKNVQKEETIDYSKRLDSISEQLKNVVSSVKLQRSEMSEKLSNIKIENKTTYLSAPDSTGKQYPTAISETKSEQEDKEKTSVETQMQATIEELSYRIDSLQVSVSKLVQSKEKVVQVSWWNRYKSDILLFALISVIIWLIYKNRNK